MVGALTRRQRLVADTDDAQARGKHETFLRTRNGHIDTPFLHPEINGTNRTDPIHEQQRWVIEVIKDLADASDVAGDTGCGFIVAGQHGLDTMVLVRFGAGVDRGPEERPRPNPCRNS